jgi:excisionase family DNA binding protein
MADRPAAAPAAPPRRDLDPAPAALEQRVWLDVAGAADRVLVSPSTIVREARAGRLRGYKVGGRKCWRFRPQDVDAWLTGTRTPVLASHDI